MKVKSRKPKGQRIFKSVKTKNKKKGGKRPFWIEPVDGGWWFCLEKGQWEYGYNGKGNMSSSYYSMTPDGFGNAYSLKAAKKLINRWNVPKGFVFRASLPYIGYDFFITKTTKSK